MGFGAAPPHRSLAGTRHRNVEADDAEDRLSSDRALPQQHARSDPRWQEDVDAAAEANQADPLAGHDNVPFAHKGDDPAGDETGDLRKADLQAVRTFDQQMLALVVFA